MGKYPPFERVTAAKLVEGDVLLVRQQVADQLWVERPRWLRETQSYVDGVSITHGQHEIVRITSELRPDDRPRRRATRVYEITVLDHGIERTFEASPILRMNRVIGGHR